MKHIKIYKFKLECKYGEGIQNIYPLFKEYKYFFYKFHII